MNIDEFYNEFNLTYNNLASNQAPGLDKYEISVYLTKAQAALVDTLYSEFEKSEEARRKLADLVATAKLSRVTIPDANILYPEYTSYVVGGVNRSNTYSLPLNSAFKTDVRYIINEQLKMNSSANTCIKDSYIDVQPVLHDELNNIIKNPYRFNIKRALRLDASYNDTPYIEILSKDKNVDYYQIRYIKNPKPIILQPLSGTDSIDGYNTISTGSMPESTHRQIVEIAAKLAYQDYKN